jgi:superoxide reductase
MFWHGIRSQFPCFYSSSKKGAFMDMEKNSVSRREFLNAAAVGAAVLAVGPVFKIAAGNTESKVAAPAIYVCSICGHVEFGIAPENCPVCHSPKEKFILNNALFTDAIAKLKDGGMKHSPVITVKKESSLVPEQPCKDISVRVGKTMHPMEEAHHIKFIDLYSDDKFISRYFIPLQAYPAVSIYVKAAGNKIRAVEWCNLHGYWQTEVESA